MSNIEWTELTWQVTSGCTMISPGCAHCYAETMAKRLAGMARKDIADGKNPGRKRSYLNVIGDDGRWNDKIELLPDSLTIPLKRRTPTTWFVNSMSDLFHEGVPFEFVDKVFAVMALTPQHTYQILTKRPKRMAEYLAGVDSPFADSRLASVMQQTNANAHPVILRDRFKHPIPSDVVWPLPNCWLGTSVEDQKRADERIPHLLRCPAATRFLSVEPLLGAVDLTTLPEGGHMEYGNGSRKRCIFNPLMVNPYESGAKWGNGGLHWIIVGGESGSGARPMNVEWARSIVRQCKEAGVACFVKQMGANPVGTICECGDFQHQHQGNGPCGVCCQSRAPYDGCKAFRATGRTDRLTQVRDPKGGDPAEWPEDLRVRQLPSGGAMKTTVAHVRSQAWLDAVAAGTAVYVGRKCPGFKGSPFGNPWKVEKGTPRGEAIKLYCQWAAGTLAHPKGKPFPHDQLETLRGKVLGCWCHPAPCHAGILAEMLNRGAR